MAAGERVLAGMKRPEKIKEVLSGAFFWLSAFYLVYCARPEDWIPGLKFVPMAKITGIAALVGLIISYNKVKGNIKKLPKEAFYLMAMVALLFLSALLSPVWKGGAFFRTLDFAKVSVAWVLTLLLVTNFDRLRRIIFIQAGSVAAIAVVSILKGHSRARLEGVLGGIYSNPNDLAFAIVLSLPFCFAFLLSTRSMVRKAAWAAAMLGMAMCLFMTASRGGFITLLVAGFVMLWHFGVQGRRFHIILAATFVGVILLLAGGGKLKDRFFAISGEDIDTGLEHRAYGSFEERKILMETAVKAIAEYPILGIGLRNFPTYSGRWKEVHMTYLQIGAEGGIPILILYLLFFSRGFRNLRRLRKVPTDDVQLKLFTGALHSSLVGFIVGALFAPEAYQYFPYFAVAYTSVLVAISEEKQQKAEPGSSLRRSLRFRELDSDDARRGPGAEKPESAGYVR